MKAREHLRPSSSTGPWRRRCCWPAVGLAGAVAFTLLPVSPLPQVDFPTISVSAGLPGASPETMASSVATPLERQFGRIAGVTEMTSSSSLGSTSITLQFDLDRDIDAAARDVQAAINAARGYLPANLPSNPTYRKVNPADSPIMILALTSSSLGKGADVRRGVDDHRAEALAGGGRRTGDRRRQLAARRPRSSSNPTLLNKYGIGLEQVRSAVAATNANTPKGFLSNGHQRWEIGANDQLLHAVDYAPLIVAYHNGAPVRLRDVGDAVDSVEDIRTAGYVNGKPSVMVIVFRAARRQHHRDRRRRSRCAAAGVGGHSPRHRHPRRHGPDDDDPRVGARRRADAAGLDRAGHSRRLRVPAKPADGDDPERRRAVVARRDVRRHVPARLQPRQPLPDGADHLHRLCRGRRDRRDREHHAVCRSRA